jgi:hypothetical protein
LTRGEEEPFGGLVVVPETELTRTAHRGERGETFAGLRARLRESLAPELQLADPVAVRLALMSVAPGIVAEDPSLGPIARRGGRAWLRIVDALDAALGSVLGREGALEIVSRGSDAVAVRARLLVRLARAHCRALLAAGMLDPRVEGACVAERVASADALRVLEVVGAREVRARGIVEWTAEDLALWRVLDAGLSRVGGRASLELPVFDRPLDAERERDPLDTVIEAVAAALDDAPLTESLVSSLGDLRMQRGDAPRPELAVEVRRADGSPAQGRAVADSVHAALAQGASPAEVVIALVSDDEASAFHILRALDELEIPVVDARASPVCRSNLLAFADDVLDVAAAGYARMDVARVLRSAYVDAGRLMGDDGASAGQSLRALARCLEQTPTAEGGMASGDRLRATVATSTVLGEDARAALAPIALRLGAAFERVVAAGATRVDHARRVRELYRELGVGAAMRTPRGDEAREDDRVSRASTTARRRDTDAWARWTQIVEAYERAATRLGVANIEVSLETFRHEIAWAMSKHATPTPAAPGAIRLLRVTDLPADDAALVVVADAHSDAWSHGPARAHLVPPSLEERLLRASDPAVRPLALAGEAQMLARLCLGTSRARRVVFTYRTHDDAGTALSPAPIVAWLAHGVPVSAWRGITSLARPLTPREWTLSTLARGKDGASDSSPDLVRRATLERRREETFGVLVDDAHPLARTLPRGEHFAPVLVEETGGAGRPLSASAIDRLASCVFQGFVTEVLRPKRAADVHDIADAREEGNLTHVGLEAAFRATSALWRVRPRDRETILRVGMAAVERAVDGARSASGLGRAVVGRVRAGVRAVLEWSVADEEWDFAYAEKRFGDHEGWPALTLERPGTRVTIRGTIDRVDVAHDASGVRVIDYKTRASSAEKHTARLGATTFQIALYARVAKEALERAEASGLYLPTQRLRPEHVTKKQADRWAAAHETEGGIARFEATVLDRVTDVRSGRVEVRPFSETSCEHCDYDGVCRKPRFAVPAPLEDEGATEGDDP